MLYNGSRRWQAAQEIGELITPLPGGLERYRPSMRYLLIDEGRYREEELEPLRNLVASLFRLENSRTPEDVEKVLQNLLQWLRSPELKILERDFTLWLERVLLPARLPGVEIPMVTNLREMNSMLAERVEEWTREWKRQGLQEGLQEGLQKGLQKGMQKGMQKGVQLGEASLLKRQLVKRFGPLTPAIESRLEEAATEQLEEWAERVLDAKSLDEVFGDKE